MPDSFLAKLYKKIPTKSTNKQKVNTKVQCHLDRISAANTSPLKDSLNCCVLLHSDVSLSSYSSHTDVFDIFDSSIRLSRTVSAFSILLSLFMVSLFLLSLCESFSGMGGRSRQWWPDILVAMLIFKTPGKDDWPLNDKSKAYSKCKAYEYSPNTIFKTTLQTS